MSLQREVAIKEYMPAALAARAAGHAWCALQIDSVSPRPSTPGLRSFVNEARLLASFDHPSLLKVLPLLGRQRHRLHGDAVLPGPHVEGRALA